MHGGTGDPRGQPLVCGKHDLPGHRRPHAEPDDLVPWRHRPLRRGIDPRRERAPEHRHSCAADLCAALGPLRRQSRLGRSVQRRALVFLRGVRAGAGPEAGLVFRCLEPRASGMLPHVFFLPRRSDGCGRADRAAGSRAFV